jgi:hypothetical protein
MSDGETAVVDREQQQDRSSRSAVTFAILPGAKRRQGLKAFSRSTGRCEYRRHQNCIKSFATMICPEKYFFASSA